MKKPFVTVKGSMIEDKQENDASPQPMKFALMTKRGTVTDIAVALGEGRGWGGSVTSYSYQRTCALYMYVCVH